MAFVDGENMGTSSVGKSLARHKLKQQAPPGEEHGGEGQAHEVTISKKPEGGFHSVAKMHDGTEKHADHPTMEHATAHMHAHFGHKAEKSMHEKEPKEHDRMAEEESPAAIGGGGGGLEAMGIAGEE